MKDFLPKTLFGAPAVVWLYLLGLLAVVAMQQLGVAPAVYEWTALAETVAFLAGYGYLIAEDK